MQITQQSLDFLLGLAAVGSILFNVYNSFRKPQISTDQVIIKLEDRLKAVENGMRDLKDTQLKSVEEDIKELTFTIQELSKTVVKLSTIIDERIPKGSPNLTPPGV